MGNDQTRPPSLNEFESVAELQAPALLLGEDLRVRQANAAFYHHFMLKPDDTIDRPLHQLGSGQWDNPELNELLTMLLRGTRPFADFEISHSSKHMGERRYLLSARADDDRKRILLVMEDMTACGLASQNLRAEEKYLGLFIEHAPLALAMFDREMKYLFASRRWRSDYGLGNRKLQGVSHYVVFPEIPERWREAHRQGLAGERLCAEADCFERADGSVQCVRWEIQPWFHADGEIGGITIFTEDVTERKRVEEEYRAAHQELKREQQFLKAVFEALPVGICITDEHGGVLRSNHMDQVIWGGPRPVTEGIDDYQEYKAWWADTGAPVKKEEWASARAVQSGESVVGQVFEIERFDGTRGYIDNSAAPIRDDEGRIIGSAVSIQDITAQRQAEMELREALIATREATLAKSNFLASMSHEIRTPMTVFLAALELLQQSDQSPQNQRLLEMADKSAKALRGLIDDVLDFSQIELQRLSLREDPFDLSACMNETIEMFSLTAHEKNIRLTLTVAEDVPGIVVGDPERLRQILVNLVGNAIKFTREGEVRVSIKVSNDFLEFAVADTGIGIPEEQHHLLFESFSQVDNSFHRQHGGSGLGLAICKGLVELMNGRISVQSHAGTGAVFTFTIPLKTKKSLASKVENEVELPDNRHSAIRVLLAEDEPMIRAVISMEITDHGWLVEAATSGDEAVHKWQQGDFDIILMDLQMPEMDGLEATRKIRQLESGRDEHTCIVGLTAHAQQRILDDCIRAGMDSVLTKPVRIKHIYAAIDQCLAK